jgi:hypothetical protein
MTIATTTSHAAWSSHAEDSSVELRFSPHSAPANDDEGFLRRVERLMQSTPTQGDPLARARLAAVLFQVTGWEVFADENDERAYVSRLWAEDWDCPEDAVYDDE